MTTPWRWDLENEQALFAALGLAPLPDAPTLRPLTDKEIALLERNGNRCDNWSLVHVEPDADLTFLTSNRFAGHVALCANIDGGGVIYSTLQDVWLGRNVTVRNVRLLCNSVIGDGAAVADCGTVSGEQGGAMGIGASLSLGQEAELPRPWRCNPLQSIEEIARCLRGNQAGAARDANDRQVERLIALATASRGVIGPGARVADTARVQGCLIGPGSVIGNATAVERCALLSTREEPCVIQDGARVAESCLQAGARVSGLTTVVGSVLHEHARVDDHARVVGSVIGPCSAIAAGEVTASLLGPLMAMHHQSLVIAVYWPGGRGNVAYGVNCGSNHTGKAPDQSFCAAEGLFLGLGCTIKFPCNLERSPYSIIAPGVMLQPSRIEFPFSLINTSTRAPQATTLNELLPGWVYGECPYMLFRCMEKFARRYKGSHPQRFDVFNGETLRWTRAALERLQAVEPREVYGERDLPGVGKTFVTESGRLAGIAHYRRCLEFAALRAAWEEEHPPTEQRDAELLEQAKLLQAELFPGLSPCALRRRWLDCFAETIRAVEACKARDDARGRRIFDDYDDNHTPAHEDWLVKQLWEQHAAMAKG